MSKMTNEEMLEGIDLNNIESVFQKTIGEMCDFVTDFHNKLFPEEPQDKDQFREWALSGKFPGLKLVDIYSRYCSFVLMKLIYGEAPQSVVDRFVEIRDSPATIKLIQDVAALKN